MMCVGTSFDLHCTTNVQIYALVSRVYEAYLTTSYLPELYDINSDKTISSI